MVILHFTYPKPYTEEEPFVRGCRLWCRLANGAIYDGGLDFGEPIRTRYGTLYYRFVNMSNAVQKLHLMLQYLEGTFNENN
jgi:hypothetical protein